MTQRRKNETNDYRFVSRENRRLQIVIIEKHQFRRLKRNYQFLRSKQNDYRFVFRKSRRLQIVNNEKSFYRKQKSRNNDFFRRNYDRSKFRFKNRHKKFKSRFRFKFNHRFNKSKNHFKHKSKF